MACCLTAPSHCLNQCWLIINGVPWHWRKANFTGIAQDINCYNDSEKYTCWQYLNAFGVTLHCHQYIDCWHSHSLWTYSRIVLDCRSEWLLCHYAINSLDVDHMLVLIPSKWCALHKRMVQSFHPPIKPDYYEVKYLQPIWRSVARIYHLRVHDLLQWCHNEHNGVSKHRRLNCLLNRLFRRRSKKSSKFRVTGLCEGNPPVNSPHEGPVTWEMFPFDDVIMLLMH